MYTYIYIMWVKLCHKPPMTGNGKHTTYKNGDDWGMVYDCFILVYPHYTVFPNHKSHFGVRETNPNLKKHRQYEQNGWCLNPKREVYF